MFKILFICIYFILLYYTFLKDNKYFKKFIELLKLIEFKPCEFSTNLINQNNNTFLETENPSMKHEDFNSSINRHHDDFRDNDNGFDHTAEMNRMANDTINNPAFSHLSENIFHNNFSSNDDNFGSGFDSNGFGNGF